MRSYEKGLWLLILLLTAAVFYAVFFLVPSAMGLGSLVRIAFFHIPVAWGAVLAFLVSAWYAVRYLRRPSARLDAVSAESARLGLIFVVLATLSGAVFSKLTWGSYWNWDPRQTTIFVLLLIYALFSFLTVPFLVFIIPRFYFSLHPAPVINGSGSIDMDPVMLKTLLASLLDMTLIYIALLCHRVNSERGVHHET
uniref:cytochrome c biogenesis protein CcsA n=1 Tax=Mitsuokella multacida TaxID=52226 RepID=UPI00402612D6